MKTKNNTILITGGATGIGFALAEAFINAGNKVIICGRRENRLKEAQQKLPQLLFKVCDVSKEKERELLFNWVKDSFKDTNILVNNAGIQMAIDFKNGMLDLPDDESEIDINFIAPVHLSAYFIPMFLKKEGAAIINLGSGMAFVPNAAIPLYCATKAAIHSFSVSLRYQLSDTSIKVFEIIPPIVDTEIFNRRMKNGEPKLKGIPPSEVARATLAGLANDEYEIVIGEDRRSVMSSKATFEQAFQRINH
jgi:uncharacterized oxidoreductase